MNNIDSIMAMMADGVKLGDGWVIDSREYIEESDEMTDYSKMLPEPYPVLQKNSATYDEEKNLLSEKRIGAEMSDEMKNCPFCGSDDIRVHITHSHCASCGAQTWEHSRWDKGRKETYLSYTENENLVKSIWNARPIEDALRERAKRAEQMVERLIAAGEVMKQACGDQWGWEDMFTDSEFTDFDDIVTEWKAQQ